MKAQNNRTVLALSVMTAVLGGGACLDIGLGSGAGAKPLDQEQTIDVAEATKLNLANQYGTITVVGEADRTQIEMVPTLNSDDPSAGTITVANDGSEVSVAVAVVAGEASVDVLVKTPKNLEFKIATGGGALDLSGMVGGGDVATGEGEAKIDMDLSDSGSLTVATGAGDIDLTLASDTAASISGAAAGGSATIDSSLNFSGTNVMGAVDGSLNGGGSASIDLSTGGGNITVSGR